MTTFKQSVKAGIGASFGVFLALAVPVMGAATVATVGVTAITVHNINNIDGYLADESNQWFFNALMVLIVLVGAGDIKLALNISKYIKD